MNGDRMDWALVWVFVAGAIVWIVAGGAFAIAVWLQ